MMISIYTAHIPVKLLREIFVLRNLALDICKTCLIQLIINTISA